MTGDMSIPPRLGMRLRIGRSTGSVMRYRKSADRRDEPVARIDHVEGDQPGQHRRGDQQLDIELQGKTMTIRGRAWGRLGG